jgi:hypothetical protein
MKNYKTYFFLVGSVIAFSISSCVRSIEKVHSADLRKLDPKLQGVRKCFDNDAVNDVYTWENKRKPELIQYYENYIFGKRPVFSPKREYTLLAQDTLVVEGVRMIHKEIEVVFKLNGKKRKCFIAEFLPFNIENPIVFVGLNFFGNASIHPSLSLTQTKNYVINNPALQTKRHRVTEASRGKKAYRWPLALIIGSGCGLATAHYGDFDADVYNGFFDGIYGLAHSYLHVRKRDEWGSISAWAWGLSEIQTCLEQGGETKNSKTVAIGHSRLGKAALWAGVTDERFDMVVSNNSGCVGAAQFKTMRGEDIQKITKRFPYWFSKNLRSFNGHDSLLLVDQEMFLSLIAPRPIYVGSASVDAWSDPEGEYLSFYKAQAIYSLYDSKCDIPFGYPSPNGVVKEGNMAYHLRAGEHEILAWDWERYIAFAKIRLN